jgi:hypothetical protein
MSFLLPLRALYKHLVRVCCQLCMLKRSSNCPQLVITHCCACRCAAGQVECEHQLSLERDRTAAVARQRDAAEARLLAAEARAAALEVCSYRLV